jgi:hypothetical protein
MKKIAITLMCLSFLVAACAKVTLQREEPSSPSAAYEVLPK